LLPRKKNSSKNIGCHSCRTSYEEIEASVSYAARPSSSQSVTVSALQQMNRCLEMDDDDDDCLAFWRHNQLNLNTLVYPAIRALTEQAFQQHILQWSVFSATMVSF